MPPPVDIFQISEVSAGKDQTLALLRTGEILGWGGAGSGRYVPPYVDICSAFKGADPKPVYVSKPSNYSNISAGFGISLGICDRQVYMWGFSQIDLGGQSPISEVPVAAVDVKNATRVAAGQFLFGAIDVNGGLYTWGLNVAGDLGRETSQINARPALVPGIPPVQAVAIGDQFMLALSRDHRVYGWGSNSSGQLGLGHLRTILQPEAVHLKDKIKSLAVGSSHALVLSDAGNVYGWGSNHFGQLANKTDSYITRPAPIAFPEPIASLAAGMHHSLALGSSGKVYAWGWNGVGQLGLSDFQSRSTPALVPKLSGVRAIAAGELHSIAIGPNNLFGWGSNMSGQIGNAETRQMVPIPFLTIG